MRVSAVLLIFLCALAAASAAPSFKLFGKTKAAIQYKVLPHLGFHKYNAVRYAPLRAIPASAPVVHVPYRAEVVDLAPAAPAGPYPAALL